MSVRLRASLPAWCKPGRLPRPHELVVELADSIRVYTVVRRVRGLTFLALLKYVEGEGAWSFSSWKLRRVLQSYAPRSVVSGYPTCYEPLYGVGIPQLAIGYRCLVCDGVEALRSILARPEARQHNALTGLVREIGVDGIYVTGSLALGSPQPFSDVDLVVSGYREALRVLDKLSELVLEKVVEPLDARTLRKWALREATWRRVDPHILLHCYRPWQRFLFESVTFTVALCDGLLRLREERRVFVTVGPQVELVCRIEPFQYSVLDYPSVAEALCEGEGLYVASFDGIDTPVLFEGGRVRVKGVKGWIVDSEDKVETVFTGLRELASYVAPLDADTPQLARY